MIQEIADALAQSWRTSADAFVQFVPRLIAATIIFALGSSWRRSPAGPSRDCSHGVASIGWRFGPAPARCCASPSCPAPSY